MSYDVHHAVGIIRQINSGYRQKRVNIMAQGLSTPDHSLSPTHLPIKRSHATTTHYIHHQVSLMVSRNTTLVPSLGLHIGPACEAGLSAGMQGMHVPPQIRKKKRRNICEGHLIPQACIFIICYLTMQYISIFAQQQIITHLQHTGTVV